MMCVSHSRLCRATNFLSAPCTYLSRLLKWISASLECDELPTGTADWESDGNRDDEDKDLLTESVSTHPLQLLPLRSANY